MPQPAENFISLDHPPLFRRRLLRWFQQNGRDLPWRRTHDPYAIMVSEFMLQQTQVATVVPYYERWLERFPSFRALARASEAEVLHAWQGLGYYARGRNLHTAAKLVVGNFGGRLPADVTVVRQLPGVGRYTAGAIASFAFDLPEPIIDTNIARTLARLTNCKLPVDTSAGRDYLWNLAKALMPKKGARRFNSALMELGALVCLARKPRCDVCPVRLHCRADNPESLPGKRARPAVVRLTEWHGLIRQGKDVLLEQSHGRWRGMWTLPRLPAAPKHAPLLRLEFPFTHHCITLAVFSARRPSAPNDRQRWFACRALDDIPVPAPHRRALAQLLPILG